MANVFSITAFFIVLRETFEASLVAGIALAYCSRMGLHHQRRFVWYGVAGGVVASIIMALGFAIPSWVGGDNAFEGKTEKLFEGFTMIVASILLTWMILWMIVMGERLRDDIEQRMDEALSRGKGSDWALGILIFFQIFREGAETVIFLFGVSENDDVPSFILPAIIGLCVAIGIAFMLFRGLVDMDVQAFFFWSSVLLILFAAGTFARAWHEFQEADWFGAYEDTDPVDRPWWNAPMWDTSGCCSDEENEFFSLMRALFGYQDSPTFVELTAYFGFLFLITAIYSYMRWDWLQSRATKLAGALMPSTVFLWVSSMIGMIYALINPTWTGILFTWCALLLSTLGLLVSVRQLAKLVRLPLRAQAIMSTTQWIAGIVLAVFAVSVIGAQLACDQAAAGYSQCFLPSFYWWMLILDDDFNRRGQTNSNWPTIAVLTISLLFTTLFCMYHSTYGYFHQQRMWMANRRRVELGEESDDAVAQAFAPDSDGDEAVTGKAQQLEPDEKPHDGGSEENDVESSSGERGTTTATEEVQMTGAGDVGGYGRDAYTRHEVAPAA